MTTTNARLMVPAERVRVRNDAPIRSDGDYVLYWMVAERRLSWSFALDHAVALALELQKPLVVLEALRVDYPWASDRMHAFVLEGMRVNAAAARGTGATYLSYVEEAPGAGRGLVDGLVARAACVVTNRAPILFIPKMVSALAARAPVRVIDVDSYGMLPLDAGGQHFVTAYAFRRHVQKTIGPHLSTFPSENPLAFLPTDKRAVLPREVRERLPAQDAHRADDDTLSKSTSLIARLPIDHRVAPSPVFTGGTLEARARLTRFLDDGLLARYAEERSHPDLDIATGLSPYLHFGHISAHEIFRRVGERELFNPAQVKYAKGARHGFYGLSASTESFLDQIVTWRELGAQTAEFLPGYDTYDALPRWARATLDEHASDPRAHVYDEETLAAGRTHDPVWNAAARQLLTTGIIHNALRMLWGKKILEWTRSPRDALATLIELNNRYALDGRNPNSYAGIFWTLGRYDRPWGPVRPIFGSIRYMSSENSARKWKLKETVARFTTANAQPRLFA
jgi:deoxyribodipyrimidine photo-lyase